MTVEEWVRSLRACPSEAFQWIWEAAERVGRRLGADVETAAEAATDLTLRIFQRGDDAVSGLPATTPLERWLVPRVRHGLVDALRRRESRAGPLAPEEADGGRPWSVAGGQDPLTRLMRAELARAIGSSAEGVRRQLRPDTWAAFLGLVVEGRTPAEVATALGKSVEAVRAARHRVVRSLAAAVRQRYGSGRTQP